MMKDMLAFVRNYFDDCQGTFDVDTIQRGDNFISSRNKPLACEAATS